MHTYSETIACLSRCPVLIMTVHHHHCNCVLSPACILCYLASNCLMHAFVEPCIFMPWTTSMPSAPHPCQQQLGLIILQQGVQVTMMRCFCSSLCRCGVHNGYETVQYQLPAGEQCLLDSHVWYLWYCTSNVASMCVQHTASLYHGIRYEECVTMHTAYNMLTSRRVLNPHLPSSVVSLSDATVRQKCNHHAMPKNTGSTVPKCCLR